LIKNLEAKVCEKNKAIREEASKCSMSVKKIHKLSGECLDLKINITDFRRELKHKLENE
jgi:hypothetical protein